MSYKGEDKIIKSKVDLTLSNPFFAYILMNMRITEKEAIATMGVNKWGDLFWNEKFVNELTQDEVKGVLAHEVGHIITRTFEREGAKDMLLWNIATDIIINYIVKQEKMSLPKCALIPDDKGMVELTGKGNKKFKIDVKEKTADEIYDILLQNAETIKSYMSDGKGGHTGGFDVHMPDDSGSGKEKGEKEKAGKGQSSGDIWKKKIVEAYTQAKARGNVPAYIERLIEGILIPKVNWKQKLYSYITKEIPYDFTMRMPSKKFWATGAYYPSVLKENVEIVVGCDASGSIGYGGEDTEGHEFLSECLGILNSFQQIKARIIFWDCGEVNPDNDYMLTRNNKNTIQNLAVKAGGGTELSCFTRYCKEKKYRSRIYIIMTDGFIEGEPEVPRGSKVLFVLSKNGSDEIIKKYGEVCKL